MNDAEILARSARNMATMWSLVAESSGGRVQRWDDAVAVDSHAPSVVPNRVTLTAPASDRGADVLKRASEFYARTGPLSLSMPWGIVDAWDVIDPSDAGFTLLVKMPAMVLDPGAVVGSPTRDDIRVERVRDDATLAAFRRALFTSFNLVPWPDDAHPLMGESFYKDPRVAAWVGLDGDEPIATSVSVVDHGIVGVYLISTHPSRRGRGIGETLSWAATLADRSLPAVLQASQPGFPVYERMGYRTVGHAAFWVPNEVHTQMTSGQH